MRTLCFRIPVTTIDRKPWRDVAKEAEDIMLTDLLLAKSLKLEIEVWVLYTSMLVFRSSK